MIPLTALVVGAGSGGIVGKKGDLLPKIRKLRQHMESKGSYTMSEQRRWSFGIWQGRF
jgi:hypothetical protein